MQSKRYGGPKAHRITVNLSAYVHVCRENIWEYVRMLTYALAYGRISYSRVTYANIVLYHPQNTHNFHFSKCNINHAEYYAPPPAGQRYPYLLKYSYRAF